MFGRKLVIETLLAHGADPNWIGDKSRCTSIEIAAEAGHKSVVALLLDAGAANQMVGRRALQRAAVAGHIKIVELLLEKNVIFDLRQDPCLSSLQMAAANGHNVIAKLLVSESQKTVAYKTALTNAAKAGNEDVVNLLLTMATNYDGHSQVQNEAIQLLLDRDAENRGSGLTLLQSAVRAGHELIVQLLLANKIAPNADPTQESPLQLAAMNGFFGIVILLLQNKADINTIGPSGTALQLAAENGHENIVIMLLKNKATVDASDNRGTPLQLAAAAGHEHTVLPLLEVGPDVNGNNDGSTALQRVATCSYIVIVEELIAYGANVHANKGKGTSLQRAARSGCIAIVEELIVHGADVNANSSSNSALQNSAAEGHKVVTEVLLKAGAKLNAQGGDYGSALQAAVLEGKVGIVELLLDRGAKDFTEGGNKRWDPLTSSWVEKVINGHSSQPPQDTSGPPPGDVHPCRASTNDSVSLLRQLARENDNKKRRELRKKPMHQSKPSIQLQRTRSAARLTTMQLPVSQLKETYSRNFLSLNSMSERSPVSSSRPSSFILDRPLSTDDFLRVESSRSASSYSSEEMGH